MKFIKIKDNLIHSTAVIDWKNLKIGKNNEIGPYCVIGNSAQHPQKKSCGKIVIGNNNKISNNVTINRPTNITKKTFIGNNNYIMNNTTIDHDCFLENYITLSSGTVLGGNIYVMNNAQLGIKTIIHQNQIIGSYSMIGMGSVITKKNNIKPGYIYYGKPAKKKRINSISLKRNKISIAFLRAETKRFNEIVKKK
jgi:UDP-N-acetylglucosamine acyltransferase